MLSPARRREERFVVEHRRVPHYYNPLPPIFPISLLLFLPLAFVLLESLSPVSHTHTLQIATVNRSSTFIILKLPNLCLQVFIKAKISDQAFIYTYSSRVLLKQCRST
jgi:hypothetical protein